MSPRKSLLQFLRKFSLTLLMNLCIIMLFHILIVTVGTSLMLWHIDSTPFDMALLTFLYYVIPIIVLLFFYILISELAKLETSHQKSSRTSTSKRSASKTETSTTSKSTPKTTNKKHGKQGSSYTPYNTNRRSMNKP